MTLRIGPLDDLRTYAEWQMDGDRFSTSGLVICATEGEAQAKRELLRALVKHGGPIQPITETTDTTVAGTYMIDRLVVSAQPGMWDGQHAFAYQLTATRLDHAQGTLLRIRSHGVEREGAPAATSEDYNLSLPSGVVGRDLDGSTAVYYTLTGPGGSVRKDVDPVLANGAVTAQLAPDDFYDMSPAMTMNSQRVIAGGAPSLAHLATWSATNGLITIAAPTSSSHTFRLTAPNPASPGSWGSVTYAIAVLVNLTANVVVVPTAIKVLSSDSERLHWQIVGWPSTSATADDYLVVVDFVLRRGSLFVEMQTSSNVSTLHRMFDSTGASYTVALSARGIERTANDADGNRLFMIGDRTMATGSAGTGVLSTNGNETTVGWAVGVTLDGSSAVAPNRFVDQADFFWADQTITIEAQ